jgi:hypothetical protein
MAGGVGDPPRCDCCGAYEAHGARLVSVPTGARWPWATTAELCPRCLGRHTPGRAYGYPLNWTIEDQRLEDAGL